MEVYAARQAIMNRRQHAVAYELLFRNGIENVFPADVDPNVATSKLVVSQPYKRIQDTYAR